MKFFTKSLLLALTTSLLLTGCNPDNSDTTTITNEPIIDEVTGKEKKVGQISFERNSYAIETNSEVVKLNVRVSDVLGGPIDGGTVNVIYPSEWTRTDVGNLLNNSVEVKDGIATFEYQAPSNLTESLLLGYQSSAWKFYYEDDTANAKAVNFVYQPTAGQAVTTNYSLEFSSVSSDKPVFPIESQHTYTLKFLDSNKELVKDSDIISMDLVVNSSILGILQDDGTEIKSASTTKSALSIVLKSAKRSGTAPVTVNVVYKDKNGIRQTLQKSFSVVVLSGPATAMSINLIETLVSEDNAGFVGRYEIKVTDKYFNLVNTNPGFSAGMIAGYTGFNPTNSDGTTRDINAIRQDTRFSDANKETGTLNQNGTYTITSGSFDSKIDTNNDIFTTFGPGYTYHASGKWEYSIANSNNLTLVDTYIGNSETGMKYAFGHNYRQVIGTAKEAVGIVKSEDDSYVINSQGSAVITVKYDPYLVGKDVVIWANLIGSNQDVEGHFGEATVVTLPGKGITASEDRNAENENVAYKIGIGQEATNVRFYIGLRENLADYRNGNFEYAIEVTGTAAVEARCDSMGMTTNSALCPAPLNIYDNSNGDGRAWVQVRVSNLTRDDSNGNEINATVSSIELDIAGDRVVKEFQ